MSGYATTNSEDLFANLMLMTVREKAMQPTLAQQVAEAEVELDEIQERVDQLTGQLNSFPGNQMLTRRLATAQNYLAAAEANLAWLRSQA